MDLTEMLHIAWKMLFKTALLLSALLIGVFCFVYFSPRPPLSIDPATLKATVARLIIANYLY